MESTHSPLISVIVPVYNGSQYITQAVHSVLASTWKMYEIILINDGSTDESKAVCKQLSKKDSRIHYIETTNKGLPATLNLGLSLAKGNYIVRLNQDDIMHEKRLETQVLFLEKHSEIVVVGSHIQYIDDKNTFQDHVSFEEKDEHIRKSWLLFSPFSDPSVMYRKETALAIDGYETNYWPADDSHFWYKMGMRGKLANIPQTLTYVRLHNSAGSIKHFRKMATQVYRIRRWVHNHIQKTSLLIQFFWLMQLFASKILSPKQNWFIYRKLKEIMYVIHTKS